MDTSVAGAAVAGGARSRASNDAQLPSAWYKNCFTSKAICTTLLAIVAIGFVAMLITGVCGLYGHVPSVSTQASVYMISLPLFFFSPPILVGLYYGILACIAHVSMHLDYNRRSNGS